jgi:hypothetical protein
VGEIGRHPDGSALRRHYKAAQARAKLRPIRFHDLRHTFGTLAARVLSGREVQELMGHADGRTTQRYLHYRPRTDEAQKLARAFTVGAGEKVPARRSASHYSSPVQAKTSRPGRSRH